MPRHTVISSRVLIVISTVVGALVLLLASSVQAAPEAAEDVGAEKVTADYPTAEYKVRAGDNLWRIADEHTPDGHDVRNTIEQIKRHNHLDSSLIRPGQVLEIPLRSGG